MQLTIISGRAGSGKSICLHLTQTLLKDIQTFLEYWLPHLIKANHRLYLTIAIGCTGGQHRSVYLIEQLAVRLRHYYP